MRRISVFIFSCLIFSAGTIACAQVTPSAYRGQMTLTAGAFGSAFQPDYAGGGVPGASPYRLYGFGAYVDLKLTRWIGFEGEARWLRQNSFVNIRQDNYLVGPRVPIREYAFRKIHATPYGKALVGLGKMNFEYNSAYGRFTDIALGGGVDVKVTRRISVRAFDFEYQLWPNWINGTLKPYGASAGIGYKIF
jgi:hypothetical protein